MKIKVEANAGFKEVDRSKKRYIVMKGSADPERAWTRHRIISFV